MGAVTFFILLTFDGISNREAWSLVGLNFFGALGFRTSEGAIFDRATKKTPRVITDTTPSS